MGQYTQLTQEKRYQIYAFMKAHFSRTNIASEIGVHTSTVSREMRRNQGKKGYRPKQAHCMAVERRQKSKKYVRLTPKVIGLIEGLLCQDLSPERVCGFVARTHNLRISHETVYHYVLADKARGGTLYRHLRHAHKKRRKRYGSYDHRGQIKGRVSIDERPAIVDARQRIGDWEIDTIIGKRHKGALLTLVERKTKFTLIRKLEKKQADLVAEAAINLLKPYKETVCTITSDNGQEFAHHKYIKVTLLSRLHPIIPYHLPAASKVFAGAEFILILKKLLAP